MGLPPKEEWKGQKGTISTICQTLNLHSGHRGIVKRVLMDVLCCEEEGTVYRGKRVYSRWSAEKILITTNSREYQILGDAMEDRHGLCATTALINEYW